MEQKRQPRKRQHVDQPLPNALSLTKKIKTCNGPEHDKYASWTYPPEFWDRLSKISLTRRALDELKRRVRRQPRPPRPRPTSRKPVELLLTKFPERDLARFARHGGPDLSRLRGCLPPGSGISVIMSSSESSRSRASKPSGAEPTVPTTATSKTTKTKRSTPYSRNFELHLEDHGVHAEYTSKKPDLRETLDALETRRPSLSPPNFSVEAFENFQMRDVRARDEDEVMADVMPAILGRYEPENAPARNTIFANLEPLTDGTIAPAVPDIYYGACPGELFQPVRDDLNRHIMPSTSVDKPWAPNFFVEVKGPEGNVAVAARQARYYGAVGSRAMQSLQNYKEMERTYDGKPHAYSSIYHNGLLRLYAHHSTAPINEGGRPEYHMTQVDSWSITGNINSFRRGVGAFRNAVDLAKQQRDMLIQAANAKAAQPQDTGNSNEGSIEVVPTNEQPTQQELEEELQKSNEHTNGYTVHGDRKEENHDLGSVGHPDMPSENPGPAPYDVVDEPGQGPVTHGDDDAAGFESTVNCGKRPRKELSPIPQPKKDLPSKHQEQPKKRRTAR